MLRVCVGSKTVFWVVLVPVAIHAHTPKPGFCPKSRDLDIYTLWKFCVMMFYVPRACCKCLWPRLWGRNDFHLSSPAEPRTSIFSWRTKKKKCVGCGIILSLCVSERPLKRVYDSVGMCNKVLEHYLKYQSDEGRLLFKYRQGTGRVQAPYKKRIGRLYCQYTSIFWGNTIANRVKSLYMFTTLSKKILT